jgi:hypothetical protein
MAFSRLTWSESLGAAVAAKGRSRSARDGRICILGRMEGGVGYSLFLSSDWTGQGKTVVSEPEVERRERGSYLYPNHHTMYTAISQPFHLQNDQTPSRDTVGMESASSGVRIKSASDGVRINRRMMV